MDENEGVIEEQETVEARATEELALVREVVLRAHPDAVPELIVGESVAELLASVEPARSAFARIVEQRPVAVETPPAVPAGAVTSAIDPSTLSAQELIRRGVAAGKRVRG
jgi:hypothetical protein